MKDVLCALCTKIQCCEIYENCICLYYYVFNVVLGFHVKVNFTKMNFCTHNFCTILSRFHFPNCLLALMKSILKVKNDNLKFLDFSHWCR